MEAPIIAELLEALRQVQAWNASDMDGFDEITPSMDMLEARAQLIREAIAIGEGGAK